MTPERLVEAMDAVGVAKIVNLGGTPGMFEHFAETFYAKYPDRFIMFVKPDPDALQRPDGVAEQLAWIKKAARMGARGVKESKSFGLGQRDADGKLVPVDDPRLAPLWDLAGQLGMPLLVHTGEPPAFWQPVDAHNERYSELLANPGASVRSDNMPTFAELMAQRERLLARHPGTNFIGAHMGMNPNDLEYVASLLDRYPNYYVDMSSVVAELGRQPRTAREFFLRYQDRILFGTDGGFALEPDGNKWTPERYYRSYFEFLETANEYIRYPFWDVAKQGNWRVYGIDLPDDVLKKIYVTNAERLIPTEASVLERLQALEIDADSAPASSSP
jgi:predicted TIM-barrel fold metal-dependent hydrolase